MKGGAYSDETFWQQVQSEAPTFVGFWTHQ